MDNAVLRSYRRYVRVHTGDRLLDVLGLAEEPAVMPPTKPKSRKVAA